MKDSQFYYNPCCSKSKKALKFLQENKIPYELNLYLEQKLQKQELEFLFENYLGEDIDLIRTKELEFGEYMLNKEVNRKTLVRLLLTFPKCLQRPLWVKNGKFLIIRDEKSLNCLKG